MTSNSRNLSENDFAALMAKRDRNMIEGVRSGQAQAVTVVAGDPLRRASQKRVSVRDISRRTLPGNPASSPYKSKWEEAYGYVMALEKQTGLIRDYGYETMTLKLAKGMYHRPDYTVWHLDGTIELRQIKGYHKNIRASLTALKWAAQRHPWYLFTLWRRVGQGWESTLVAV